jgi:iron complex transport system ATP-binding protein
MNQILLNPVSNHHTGAVDLDIRWETPARMETAEIQATRNPDMPAGAMPVYAWMAGEAGVIKDMRRYLLRDVT